MNQRTEQKEQPFKRVMVPMPDALIEEINDFRFAERRDSQADAVRELIRRALTEWRKSTASVEAPKTGVEAVAAGMLKADPKRSGERKAAKKGGKR